MTLSFYNEALKSIPYAESLEIFAEEQGEEILFRLPYADHLIGNYVIQAVHGGALCSFLEIIASVTAQHIIGSDHIPKIINVNYNFLKPAFKETDIYGKADIIKSGKRILSVSATAYNAPQGDALTMLHANFLA